MSGDLLYDKAFALKLRLNGLDFYAVAHYKKSWQSDLLLNVEYMASTPIGLGKNLAIYLHSSQRALKYKVFEGTRHKLEFNIESYIPKKDSEISGFYQMTDQEINLLEESISKELGKV